MITDYMKVIDITAKTLKADKSTDVQAFHDKTDIYDVTFESESGASTKCRFVFTKYEMILTFPKKDFATKNDFIKWISLFEYEVEQTFFLNITVKTEEDTKSYKAIVSS